MRRKAVSRRLRSVAEVRAALDTHRERIAARLDERRPPAAAFSYRAQLGHLDHELAAVEERLIAAEDEHVRREVRLAGLRRRRDALLAGLYEKQTSTRRILAGLYGADRDFELAAISGRTPQRPQPLSEQVDQTIQLLRRPVGGPPARRLDGVEVDFVALALDLETALAALTATRAELERTLKAADATRARLHGAIAELDAVFPSVVQTLEGLFRLAGETRLADRIRTSPRAASRRSGEAEKEAEEEAAAGEEPASELGAEAEAEPASPPRAAEPAPFDSRPRHSPPLRLLPPPPPPIEPETRERRAGGATARRRPPDERESGSLGGGRAPRNV